MKRLFLTLTLCLSMFYSIAQVANDNSSTINIDGKEFKTAPRRIMIGAYWWITANDISPDRSLRIWLARFDGKETTQPGKYLILDYDGRENKKYIPKDYAQYQGVAAIKYVEETRTPRMEYHQGKSANNNEELEATLTKDGFLELKLSKVTLDGYYWKEKATATVFGGVGRLMNKLEDKATTKATGYESDIDPEGMGYRRQDKQDKIELSGGVFRIKIK